MYSAIPDQRSLSRRLVAMFTEDNEVAFDILRQMFPRGLLHFLLRVPLPNATPDGTPTEHSGPRTREEILRQRALKKEMLKRHLETAASVENSSPSVEEGGLATCNWESFWGAIARNFNRGDLIWNDTTRKELHVIMSKEIESLGLHEQAAVLTDLISWNFMDFEVKYPSLEAEPMIGNLYLMRLLERREKDENVERRLLDEVKRDGHTGTKYHPFVLCTI